MSVHALVAVLDGAREVAAAGYPLFAQNVINAANSCPPTAAFVDGFEALARALAEERAS